MYAEITRCRWRKLYNTLPWMLSLSVIAFQRHTTRVRYEYYKVGEKIRRFSIALTRQLATEIVVTQQVAQKNLNHFQVHSTISDIDEFELISRRITITPVIGTPGNHAWVPVMQYHSIGNGGSSLGAIVWNFLDYLPRRVVGNLSSHVFKWTVKMNFKSRLSFACYRYEYMVAQIR